MAKFRKDLGVTPEGLTQDQLLDAVVAAIGKGVDDTARKILERKIRDFEKSQQKKVLEIKEKESSLGRRGAPRSLSSVSELDEILSKTVDKTTSEIQRKLVQMEKEYDYINTLLETSGGLASDVSKINQVRQDFQKVVDDSERILVTEANKVRKKGIQAIADRDQKEQERQQKKADAQFARDEKKRFRDVNKDVQELAIQSQRDYLEAHKDELELTTRETISLLIDKIALMGRRGTVSTDKRVERLKELNERAKQAALADAEMEFNLQGIPQDQRKTPTLRSVEGFRKQDLGVPMGKVAGLATVTAIVDQIMKGFADNISNAIAIRAQKGTPASTVAGISALGDLPGMYTVRVFDKMLIQLETIASNTEKEVGGFAPLTVMARVETSIAMMAENMRRGREMDALLSQYVRERGELDIALQRFGDRLFQEFGPFLVQVIEFATAILDALGDEDSSLWDWVEWALMQPLAFVTGPTGTLATWLAPLLEKLIPEDEVKNQGKENPMRDIELFLQNRSSMTGTNYNLPPSMRRAGLGPQKGPMPLS